MFDGSCIGSVYLGQKRPAVSLSQYRYLAADVGSGRCVIDQMTTSTHRAHYRRHADDVPCRDMIQRLRNDSEPVVSGALTWRACYAFGQVPTCLVKGAKQNSCGETPVSPYVDETRGRHTPGSLAGAHGYKPLARCASATVFTASDVAAVRNVRRCALPWSVTRLHARRIRSSSLCSTSWTLHQ